MRVLAWLILLCIAMTKAMPGGNPRMTQNSQQTAQTEEQKDGDDEDQSPFLLRRRMISSQKTSALKSAIKAVKDSGSQHIHGTWSCAVLSSAPACSCAVLSSAASCGCAVSLHTALLRSPLY
jgi:hypothetical protein